MSNALGIKTTFSFSHGKMGLGRVTAESTAFEMGTGGIQ